MANLRGNSRINYNGPTLEDCQKCYDTIRTDLITDCQIRLEFQSLREPDFLARLVLWSPGLDPETGAAREHVWSTKELQASFEAITYRQLYDLLIVGYRRMELHLGGQAPLLMP